MFHKEAISVAVAAAILAAIIYVLRNRGAAVQLRTCVFVLSLTSTQLLVKTLNGAPFHFKFPCTVTTLHFVAVWVYCILYWLCRGEPSKILPLSTGSLRRYVALVLPIALSFPLSVAFNNQALLYLGAGLNAIIGTVTPVTTAVIQQTMGRVLARMSWFGVALAFSGGIVIALGEMKQGGSEQALLRASIPGLLLAFAAVILRSLKVVFQDVLLKPTNYYGDNEAKPLTTDKNLDPMHLWAVQAPPCVAVSLLYTLYHENPIKALGSINASAAWLLAVTCVSATALNILGMYTINTLGASSMQIIGKVNIIITVTVSVVFFDEVLPLSVLSGTGLVLCGVAVFEASESAAAARLELPTKAKQLATSYTIAKPYDVK